MDDKGVKVRHKRAECFVHDTFSGFVDNDAAVSALVRGSSKQPDAASIVHYIHWLLVHHNIRAWFEWVDTDSNPSDGLSRDGIHDEWSLRQGFDLCTAATPSWHSMDCAKDLARWTLGLRGL